VAKELVVSIPPPGKACDHVAAGTVRVTVGDETAELVAGDSCSCRTDAPHWVENPNTSVEALIYLIVERG
jgi:quercetin dioxygenase-like cupin family protein